MKTNTIQCGLLTLVVSCLVVVGCDSTTEDAALPEPVDTAAEQPAQTAEEPAATETTDLDPAPAETTGNPLKEAYFGNFHIHTGWSFDAYTNGCITGPDDAFRWAKGEEIPGGGDGTPLKAKVPLDWYMVSDHAEYLGVFKKMEDSSSPISKLPIAKEVTSTDRSVAFMAFSRVLDGVNTGIPDPDLNDPEVSTSIWQEVVNIADRHNDPGKFTTFSGFEYTSAPDKRNLHRVVIFKDSDVMPDLPFSTFDSDRPEDLWAWMDQQRANGSELLAITHNGNASNGLMFPETTSYGGSALNKEYAETRMRNEPVYEVSQVKGTSETHPNLSPNDEFAGFEIWDYTLSAHGESVTQWVGGYARDALKRGLLLDTEGNGNPYKFGFIGDSDSHNAAASIEEDNHTGKFGIENNPSNRLNGPPGVPELNQKQIREFSSGGVAGIWAEENTRDSLFRAIENKETFATSGPRMKVRFFGSFDYAETLLDSSDWVREAYAAGVPMGGDLSASGNDAPRFAIFAAKEADGANLDRIQIIKGWVKDGETFEKIYNVAVSDGREVDADGNVASVGSTVDPATATYTNDIGDPQLAVVWTDPDFDPQAHAFYYARVLQIPTPRWSTYDAVTLGIPPRDDLPVSIQERAWSSPIWYTP